jgi:hypothetical protein
VAARWLFHTDDESFQERLAKVRARTQAESEKVARDGPGTIDR